MYDRADVITMETGGELTATSSANLIESFRRWMGGRVREDSTTETYVGVIETYIKGSTNFPILSSDRLNEYVAGIKNNQAPTTIRKKLAALKAFFRSQNVEFPFDSGELPKVSYKYQPTLTNEELLQMLDYVWKHSSAPFYQYRNRAIIGLSVDKGFRRGEFAIMNLEDIEWATKASPHTYIRLHTLKHGKVVKRRLTPQTAQYLYEYVWGFRRYRRKRQGKTVWKGNKELITLYGKPKVVHPLWTTSNGIKRIQKRMITTLFKTIREKCGIDKHRAGYHASRRTVVTSYHDGGASEAQITEEMGWMNPNTVKTYILPDRESVQLAIYKADINRGILSDQTGFQSL